MKIKFTAWAFFLIGLILIGAEGEGMEKIESQLVNRAPWAVVSASSYRRARLSEVKGGSILLYAPQVWNHWLSGYVQDKSTETFWACKNASGEWIELELGNSLLNQVPVSKLIIHWGKDRPKVYSLLVSKDGKTYQKIREINLKDSDSREFDFAPQILARSIRIEFHKSETKKGISIKEIEVYGPEAELMPGPVLGVEAKPLSKSDIQLSWRYSPQPGPAYLFKIYRSEEPNFGLDLSHLIEETDKPFFVDRFLEPGTTYYYKVVSESFSGDRNLTAPKVFAQTDSGAVYYRLRIRGVIEGFYNQPWTHPERIRMLRFMARSGFNYYIYAPKNDPYHRQLWRESYPLDEQNNFRELVQSAKALGITFNYGVSPGLNIDYNQPKEKELLKAKLKQMFELGVRAFTLCLDDIPGSAQANQGMALDQIKLVNELYRFLKFLDKDCQLFFVPTVYSFPYSHWPKKNPNFASYLETLAQIEPEVLIMWTGPSQTFSEEIDLKSSSEYQRLWGRKILIWDNYPVNDGGLQNHIFLGPYLGRDLKLGEAVEGIFSNPMFLPNASYIPLFTMGRYFTAPDYDPWQAYQEAIDELGKGAEGALKDLSDCLLNHPLFPSRNVSQIPVKNLMDDFWSAYQAGDWELQAGALKAVLERYAHNPKMLANLDNKKLWYELKPSSEKLSLYAQASLLALDYLLEKDPLKKKSAKRQAIQLLESANQIKAKVADNRIGFIYSLLLGKSENRALFEEFIQNAVK